jgi:hypothetical protein
MMIDLTSKLLEKQKARPVEIGRYSVSRLWGVLNGYCLPGEFLKGEKIDFKSALNMRLGTLKHDLVQELLPDWELEVKKEYKHKDWILVGKCDATQDDTILEIKTSDKVIEKAKRWHEWQVKMYLGMFDKENGIIVQPVIKPNRLLLKEIGSVKKNNDWFIKELGKIDELHKELVLLKKGEI